jgi:hypothetical protein
MLFEYDGQMGRTISSAHTLDASVPVKVTAREQRPWKTGERFIWCILQKTGCRNSIHGATHAVPASLGPVGGAFMPIFQYTVFVSV